MLLVKTNLSNNHFQILKSIPVPKRLEKEEQLQLQGETKLTLLRT